MNRVKNIVAKGEIAHYEQYLLLSKCLQTSSAANASESFNMWGNNVVKGEIAKNEHFRPYATMFSTVFKNYIVIQGKFFIYMSMSRK